jgi:hypothetical protein
MKSGGPKFPGKKSRQRRSSRQQSAASQNIEQQYEELLQLRERIGSLAKAAAESRQKPKRKSRD